MKWFNGNYPDMESVRREYFTLARQHHPDVGGSVVDMQEINSEYVVMSRIFAKDEDTLDVDQILQAVMDKLIALHGIKVEICGLWIWVSGDTYSNKDALKSAGLRYSGKKQMWYYAGVPVHTRRHYSMDEIRAMHGSKVAYDDERKPLP